VIAGDAPRLNRVWCDCDPLPVRHRMTKTKRKEHQRLQRRTDKLKQEHAALSRDRTPFNQKDHDKHGADLAQHKRDLAANRSRPSDTDGDSD